MAMKLFKYETHAHTSEVSKCSSITGVDIVRFYKSCGYDGIVITDHFFNGNTSVPRELSWEERVELFCRGYENAKVEGDKIGIDVFFGWEYSYRATDFLTYGLDKKWLLDHPEVIEIRTGEYCDLVHESGGYIVQAHPFSETDYIEMIRLMPRHVDAVEVVNGGINDFANRMADQYADNYRLKKSAGSDTHSGQTDRLCGIQLNRRLESIEDMVRAMKDGETEIFVYKLTNDCKK